MQCSLLWTSPLILASNFYLSSSTLADSVRVAPVRKFPHVHRILSYSAGRFPFCYFIFEVYFCFVFEGSVDTITVLISCVLQESVCCVE
jgi:hypothetical protein